MIVTRFAKLRNQIQHENKENFNKSSKLNFNTKIFQTKFTVWRFYINISYFYINNVIKDCKSYSKLFNGM